ncbi:MAG: sulfotransferase domain-containing protein [Acidobacteriota bacterium]
MRHARNSLASRISNRLWQLRKRLRWLVQRPATADVLCIVGCQRSGTTLMLRIFDRDPNARVFGEASRLSSNDPNRIRLDPLPEVRRRLERERAPLLVLKPLVESQRTPELLAALPLATRSRCRALWVFRHYRDVAASDLAHFGINNGIANLRPIAEGVSGNWRSENVSPDVRDRVCERFGEVMNPHDAAVLFWWVRNRLFFDLALDANPAVLMCRYEDLVAAPAAAIQEIYDALDLPFLGERSVAEVHAGSLQRGRDLSLSPEVEELASSLLDRLETAYRARRAAALQQTLSK